MVHHKGREVKAATSVLFLAALLSGCALTPTRSDLNDVKSFPKVEKQHSVSFRFVKVSGNKGLHGDPSFEAAIEKAFVASGFFSSVVPVVAPGGGKNAYTALELDEGLPYGPPEHIATDLFIDIYNVEPSLGPHGYMWWGLFHFATLGMLPIRIGQDLDLHAEVYKSDGTSNGDLSLKGSNAIWGWTPLFFVNGFKLFPDLQDREEPARIVAIKNMLLQLHSQGKI